jgi:hypothetical protein
MANRDDYKWKFWNPDTEPLPENPKEYRKISICTTCMNRTYDLRQILEKNINDNSDYCNVEFVILNYGSKDDLDDFIWKDMKQYITGGVLKYVKVDADHFEMGHSRNIAFKSASGQIVNNVDADNFINNCINSIKKKFGAKLRDCELKGFQKRRIVYFDFAINIS